MNNRKIILHGLGALVAGGAERAAVDLMISMKDRGLDVELACMIPRRDSAGERWAARLADADIPVHTGPTPRISARSILWLRNLLTANDLALFHVHLNYVERAYCLSRWLHRRKYGVLRKLHNSIVPTCGWQKRVFDKSDIRISIANGETTRQNFEGKITGEILSIANGMDFYWPIQNTQNQAESIQVLGLATEKRHVVCVGSMVGESTATAQKAHDVLIDGWKRSGLGQSGVVLHLLGDGNLRPKLESLAKGAPSIVFHGVQSRIDHWLTASSAFILPSRWEGLPNAAIEALGTGTPCVFSDIGPCKELAASHVRYFKTDEPSELSEKLLTVLAQPPTMNMHEIQQIRDHYGMKRPTNLYLAAYAKALTLIPGTDEVLKKCNY